LPRAFQFAASGYTNMNNVIVWDIETAPDIKGFAAANGQDGKTYDEIRTAMGDKFPKHIYHSIIWRLGRSSSGWPLDRCQHLVRRMLENDRRKR
jgi:hypothetical protein